MIVLKESTDYLEMRKSSIDREISEIKDKISSNQKQLDETRSEKYNIDRQKNEAQERISWIKTIWIPSFIIIFLLLLFTFSINILIPIGLSVFVVLIASYLSKNYFRDQNTYDEQHRISVEKEKKIEDYSKIISQDIEKMEYLNKKYNDYTKGLIGENKVTEMLKRLEYDNYLINDITLDKAFGNIDHILVSRYGLFIIETKNWDGEIICNGDRWNKHYENDYNPVDLDIMSISKRLKGNAKKLRLSIESNVFNNLMNIWVDGIIVFTDTNAKLQVINPTIPVLTIEKLNDYIKGRPLTRFSSRDLESIANFVYQMGN